MSFRIIIFLTGMYKLKVTEINEFTCYLLHDMIYFILNMDSAIKKKYSKML